MAGFLPRPLHLIAPAVAVELTGAGRGLRPPLPSRRPDPASDPGSLEVHVPGCLPQAVYLVGAWHVRYADDAQHHQSRTYSQVAATTNLLAT